MTIRAQYIALFIAILFCVPLIVRAQSDGSVPEDHTGHDMSGQAPAPTTPPPADGTQGSAPTDSAVAPAQSGTVRPTPAPITPTTPTNPTNPITPPSTPNTNSGGSGAPIVPEQIDLGSATIEATALPEEGTTTPSNSNAWLWPVVAVLALIPFGFLVAGFLRKKPEASEESNNRCFDIKQMMEAKLKELTDVKVMIKEKAIEKSKEAIRDAVSGSATGDLLVRAEKLEEQYHKLKKLFEECQIDIDQYRYKGVLVENSLLDKEILKHVKIIRSRDEGDWKLHDIRLSKKQISDIQKSIAEKGWYFHLWEPGKDVVTVVFKDRLFEIKHSDKATWKDAIAYGVAQGIPESQLDFVLV